MKSSGSEQFRLVQIALSLPGIVVLFVPLIWSPFYWTDTPFEMIGNWQDWRDLQPYAVPAFIAILIFCWHVQRYVFSNIPLVEQALLTASSLLAIMWPTMLLVIDAVKPVTSETVVTYSGPQLLVPVIPFTAFSLFLFVKFVRRKSKSLDTLELLLHSAPLSGYAYGILISFGPFNVGGYFILLASICYGYMIVSVMARRPIRDAEELIARSKKQQRQLNMYIGVASVLITAAIFILANTNIYFSSGLGGYVFDRDTRRPIEGAQVEVDWHFDKKRITRGTTTDDNGYFRVRGWYVNLAKEQNIYEHTPDLSIDKNGYHPYLVTTKKPKHALLGYVSSAPTDPCEPNGNYYYLDTKDKLNLAVSHQIEKFEGYVTDQAGRLLKGATVRFYWYAEEDKCQSLIERELAEFTTSTNTEGRFVIKALKFDRLPQGFRIPIDQPTLWIGCKLTPQDYDIVTSYNPDTPRAKHKFYPPGRIDVDWTKYNFSFEDEQGESYNTCHQSEAELEAATHEWVIKY